MKINNKSLPAFANPKEVKIKLEAARKEEENYTYDVRLNEHTVIVMELNYGSLKWDCVATYIKGFKIA
jgi:hypothetical protein